MSTRVSTGWPHQANFNPPGEFDSLGAPKIHSAVSGPAFAPERGEIWYTDLNYGFFALRVTNGVWPFKRK